MASHLFSKTFSKTNLLVLLLKQPNSNPSMYSAKEMDLHYSTEILHDFSPRLRVYKDGHFERLRPNVTVPPSYDPKNRVQSKDVTISPGVSARIYMPLLDVNTYPSEDTKLPVYTYFHGGAFCLYSSSTNMIHNCLNSLVSEAKVIAVSVDYRLAPEFPIPTCYEDSWAVSHSAGTGPDLWLNQWADFGRVFLAGESAGANIAHSMLARSGPGGLLGRGVRVSGLLLVHPFFVNEVKDELIEYLCEGKLGLLDPRLNPAADPARMRMEVGCGRVFVCVDEEDWLKDRGLRYYEALKGSGWEGEVELMVTNGGGHTFHVGSKPDCDEAVKLVKHIATFVNNK